MLFDCAWKRTYKRDIVQSEASVVLGFACIE